MERIGITEARRHLPRLLHRVALGESLTIMRDDNPVTRLMPVAGKCERAQHRSSNATQPFNL